MKVLGEPPGGWARLHVNVSQSVKLYAKFLIRLSARRSVRRLSQFAAQTVQNGQLQSVEIRTDF